MAGSVAEETRLKVAVGTAAIASGRASRKKSAMASARHGDEHRRAEQEGEAHHQVERPGQPRRRGGARQQERRAGRGDSRAAQGPREAPVPARPPGEAEHHDGEADRHHQLAPRHPDAEGHLAEAAPLHRDQPVGGPGEQRAGGGGDRLAEEGGGPARPAVRDQVERREGEVAPGGGGEERSEEAHPQRDVLCEHRRAGELAADEPARDGGGRRQGDHREQQERDEHALGARALRQWVAVRAERGWGGHAKSIDPFRRGIYEYHRTFPGGTPACGARPSFSSHSS